MSSPPLELPDKRESCQQIDHPHHAAMPETPYSEVPTLLHLQYEHEPHHCASSTTPVAISMTESAILHHF